MPWQRLKVPPFCDRLIALTIPANGELVVLSYEGAHRMWLRDPIVVEDYHCEPDEDFDPQHKLLNTAGRQLPTIGLYGSTAAITSHCGEQLYVDVESQVLTVFDEKTSMSHSYKYENFSGDWAVATFSSDGQFIVLACPYDFDFVVLSRTT